MIQHIHDGTAQELASRLAQRPAGRFRLIEFEDDQKPVSEEVEQEDEPSIDAENAAAIALFKAWREQDATDDPEEIRKAVQELEEFKSSVNVNSVASGERRVYP